MTYLFFDQKKCGVVRDAKHDEEALCVSKKETREGAKVSLRGCVLRDGGERGRVEVDRDFMQNRPERSHPVLLKKAGRQPCLPSLAL